MRPPANRYCPSLRSETEEFSPLMRFLIFQELLTPNRHKHIRTLTAVLSAVEMCIPPKRSMGILLNRKQRFYFSVVVSPPYPVVKCSMECTVRCVISVYPSVTRTKSSHKPTKETIHTLVWSISNRCSQPGKINQWVWFFASGWSSADTSCRSYCCCGSNMTFSNMKVKHIMTRRGVSVVFTSRGSKQQCDDWQT